MPNINKINVNNIDYDIAAGLLSPGSYINGQLYKGNNDIKNRFVCTTAGSTSAKMIDVSMPTSGNPWKMSDATDIWVQFTNTNTASNITFNFGFGPPYQSSPVVEGQLSYASETVSAGVLPNPPWYWTLSKTGINFIENNQVTIVKNDTTYTRSVIYSGSPISGQQVLLAGNILQGSSTDNTISGGTLTVSYYYGGSTPELLANEWYHFLFNGSAWINVTPKKESWNFILSDYTLVTKIIHVEPTKPLYNITTTLTDVSASATNPARIQKDNMATLVFEADDGYEMPSSVTVSGATVVSYTPSGDNLSATLIINNPTGAVSITVTGEQHITIVNLMPTASYKSGLSISSTNVSGSTAINGVFYIPITVGKTYTLVKNYLKGQVFRVCFTSVVPAVSTAYQGYQSYDNTVDKVIATAPTGSAYLVFQVHGGSTDGDIHENMFRWMSVWESADSYGYNVTLTAEEPSPSGYYETLYTRINSTPSSSTDASFYADEHYSDQGYDGKICSYLGTELAQPITLKYITNISLWGGDCQAWIDDNLVSIGSDYSSATSYNITANSTLKLQSITDD